MVAAGTSVKSSSVIQREDVSIAETHLWINILHGKMCQYAASGTCTFDSTPPHTTQIALAAWMNGGKAD
jgi:hypothetical protein